MKSLLISGLLFLASCSSHSVDTAVPFQRNIPDTTEGWVGEATKEGYHEVKRLEARLRLPALSDGTADTEVRVWNLSGFYDPQVLFLLKKDSSDGWRLRTVSFYKSKGDSIYADYSKALRRSAVDSLGLNRYWTLPSQSDLKAGDSYGCMDGVSVLIEMSGPAAYRFMWYRCPDINKDKDSVFLLANHLADQLDALAVEH